LATGSRVEKRVFDGFIIQLTDGEAVALRTLLRSVAGSPDKTARKYTDAIEDVLDKMGVPEADNIILRYCQFKEDSDLVVEQLVDKMRCGMV
jgi:hypothetical protein